MTPMHLRESQRLQAGDTLPPFQLPAAPDGAPHLFPSTSRDALVLLLLPQDYLPWSGYLAALAGAADDIEHWYARILVVVGAELQVAGEVRKRAEGRLTVLADPQAEAHRRLGIAPGRAGLHIVDRYGQVYCVFEAEQEADLPGVGEIEEWTKFLATQCPECGVIDAPGHDDWTVTP
jgi:hypothetical protein